VETPLATRQEIRAFDRYAIETLGIPGIVLMENAGRQIAQKALQMLRAGGGRNVVIVAGRGNNGGDGFVAARHLALGGIRPRALLLAKRGEVAGDAATNLRILEAMGLGPEELPGDPEGAAAALAPPLRDADLILDGLLGTGARGRVREPFAAAIRAINDTPRAAVLAIDIPSGLDCDTGEPLGNAVRADHTVTLAAMKQGLARPGARAYTGEVTVADIGVPFERRT
jgi:NAD(P)H-hydrate epimerase